MKTFSWHAVSLRHHSGVFIKQFTSQFLCDNAVLIYSFTVKKLFSVRSPIVFEKVAMQKAES